MENSFDVQKQVISENRNFIVEHLDAEDVMDELIRVCLMSRSGAQRVRLAGKNRVDKNRIICEQLAIAGPGTVKKFCKILRKSKNGQMFIADQLEKSECEAIQCTFTFMLVCQEFIRTHNKIIAMYTCP